MSERVTDYYNQLAKELKRIEDEITAIKTRQFIGSDSIRTYKNLSAAGQSGGWDINTSDTWVAPQTQKIRNYAVIFEADTQDAPFNNLSLYTEINGVPATPAQLTKLNQSPVFFNSILHDYFLVYAGLAPEPGKDGFYFATISYVSGTNIKVRLEVESTDTGTVTIVEI